MLLDELRAKLNDDALFADLRLTDAVFRASKRTLKLHFVMMQKPTAGQEEVIKSKANEIVANYINDKIDVQYDFRKDFMDCDLAVSSLRSFFQSNFAVLYSKVENNISADDESGTIVIKITADNEIAALFKQMDVINRCGGHFSTVTNFPVSVKFDIVKKHVNKTELREWTQHKQDIQIAKAAFRPKRTVQIADVTEYIGRKITDIPRFIVDADHDEKYVTVCGQVQNPAVKVTASGYTLFNFNLADHTGTIKIVMFPNDKPEMMKKLTELQTGTEVVVKGSVAFSDYSGVLELKGYDISLCRICEPDYLSQPKRPVPPSYTTVFPRDFSTQYQTAMFSERKVPENIIGHTFVVFYFETTGIAFLTEKVIELGAVKIENGVITQEFGTFTNPERPISEKITEITGITDKDVENAPVFEEVIADFYKFCDGATLVAHNMEFDFSFLKFNTKDSGYVFSHPQIDTLSLARQFYALPQNRGNRPGNYQLSTLVNFLNIPMLDAHRAIDDARMTAELFLIIMSEMR
jgi:DNA polymerase III epsilon subunit family exonuclease